MFRFLFFFVYIPTVIFSHEFNDYTHSKIYWDVYKIEHNIKLPIPVNLLESSRSSLSEYAISKSLESLDVLLENIIVDDFTMANFLENNESFSQEYSIFLQNTNRSTFFSKNRHLYSSYLIPLRGSKSLLSILPLSWLEAKYEDLESKEDVGEAYFRKNISASFFQTNTLSVPFSGVIIDMRGLNFQESLSPKVFSEDGILIYGVEFLKKEIGVQRGVAGFYKNAEEIEAKIRVGNKPLYIAAYSSYGKNRNNVVISLEDTQKIFSHKKTLQALLKARIIFITD